MVPNRKNQSTGLGIKWEVGDVDFAASLEDRVRPPGDLTCIFDRLPNKKLISPSYPEKPCYGKYPRFLIQATLQLKELFKDPNIVPGLCQILASSQSAQV
uniref:Uncharacterized protein n=1 Tax=Magallana gigas TaxID=29159 RepID=K1R0Z8_MAGGI